MTSYQTMERKEVVYMDDNLLQTQQSSKTFGVRVFNRAVMEKMLPQEVKENLFQAIDGTAQVKREYADIIALAMKEWAMSYGATHYSHWFQPLTGIQAEKHDSFIDWKDSDSVIETFSGSQLIQGEPDASSFPSGGLRSTYEARGYTGWDLTSHVFIWNSGGGATLCIPSVFFSWTGEVLDNKIPLLRSDKKLNVSVMRLLKHTRLNASSVFSTVGWEQEYFVVDRALSKNRPDLVLLGATVYGSDSPKGQDLQDHYFGTVKDRILRYMMDCEERALELGIPVKTRHNEVAPAQHELAIVYEKASRSVDHNLMMMEIMRQTAVDHDLRCLLGEKPFAGLNGSGKHNNWSLATDTGINLLDPTDRPETHLSFIILLTALLHGVHAHAGLLRSTVASFGNDKRLGGHEAPPAIMSVYLGEALEALLDEIEADGDFISKKRSQYDLGVFSVPELRKDNTDRNRTSPFAFTGNKFEFRAVGSAQSCAFPITVINVIVSQSLNKMLDEIEAAMGTKTTKEDFAAAAMPVLRKYLKESKGIRFSGDNYSDEWAAEAEKRNLPNVKHALDAFAFFLSKDTVHAFEGILSESELQCRYEVQVEKYFNESAIQFKLMVEMFKANILPAALNHQKSVAKTLALTKEAGLSTTAVEKELLGDIQEKISRACEALKDLETSYLSHPLDLDFAIRQLPGKFEALRESVDALEKIVDDKKWPYPKYWQLLFLV